MSEEEEGASTPRSLREIQACVGSLIRRPLVSGRKLRSGLSDDASARAYADAVVRPTAQLSACERVAIYNRQYWYRLLDVLYDDLPGIRAVLGEERFLSFRVAYLTRFPSRSFSLGKLSRHVVEFLEEDPSWGDDAPRLLLDMARLELAHLSAYDGAELPRVGAETLAGTPPDHLNLTLQPYLTLLDLEYPVDEFLISRKRTERERSEAGNDTLRREDRTEDQALPSPLPVHVVVHRVGGDVFYKRIERAPFELLTALARGETVAIACAHITENYLDEFGDPRALAESLHQWFSEWARLGWFAERTHHERSL